MERRCEDDGSASQLPPLLDSAPGDKEREDVPVLVPECDLLVGGGLRADWDRCVSSPLLGGQDLVSMSAPLCRGEMWPHSMAQGAVALSLPCLPNPSTIPSLCPGF